MESTVANPLATDRDLDYLNAFRDSEHAQGLTHALYRYPAGASPAFVRHLIQEHSDKNQVVMDPFMGGGTTVVEAIAHGRAAIGIDINPLSLLITGAKTTLLYSTERDRIIEWSNELCSRMSANYNAAPRSEKRLRNVSPQMAGWFYQAKNSILTLNTSRERRFARCILLRWGQRLLSDQPTEDDNRAGALLMRITNKSITAHDLLAVRTKALGVSKKALVSRRRLHCTASEDFPFVNESVRDSVKLIVTSPPYPGVHAIYHRWQIRGRQETPSPYYLASRRDGHGESHYTLGGRHAKGLLDYFDRITTIFRNIKPALKEDCLVFQILGFSSPVEQANLYLEAMDKAGYQRVVPEYQPGALSLSRNVPHRKWYTRHNSEASGQEFLFIHRPM